MKELRTVNEWYDVLEQSKKNPLFVLKHSTTCPVSAAAYNAFESSEAEVPKYFLKVQESRPVSNEIESNLRVEHQSPQLFLLKDGKAVWQATHYSISGSKIGLAVKEYGSK
ncbi:bacillithiol system redox-active protein YtxJ [Sporosarcina sp. ANT_H38]|uniref:bacillithiol system redox-active protein YtxJ n=1 Tax=Sporosarcina sp. ANT_H38 TaxID=2597358 RepID=UPI0011F1986F|nr:bacillithiol system redox-active protein YtxJ [Sporosarcina sp. ANT_H38]KAA0948736.1 bacillithiol system redox-active protein YtxJ [Sporosarcina sp. ANT_H38]